MKESRNVIRVAHIIGKWVGGGVESVVMNYYKYIAREKIQFDFICDEDSTNIPYDEIEKLGGKVILIPPYQRIVKYHKTLKNVLKDGNYKIVHSHINTLSVFSLFAAKCAGVPVRIAHSHNGSYEKTIKGYILHVFSRFSKYFSTCNWACSKVAGKYLFGKKKFEIVYNGIDTNKFQFNPKIRKNKRNELNIKESEFVIGHIGRFELQKNHKFIIKLLNDLYKDNKNIKLLLIGIG